MADDFLSTYAPLANDIATRTGVDPSVVLGIIDTETGHGVHVLGNNIFGITPPGGVARYPDVQTAANAFITLMQTPRYRGVAAATDPASQAAALVKGGYNTVNPQYASIVANKALSIGKQLGYQDNSGGGQGGPAVYSTSSQPVATADQPTATSYSDSPAPAAAPQQPAQQLATTGSAKDRVLSDPALGGSSSTAPASGGSAKDRVLADPALKTTGTTTTTQETPETTVRGAARNVAAGVLQGAGGALNFLSDPAGNLMRVPLTAGAFLYDAGARATGLYNPLTPEQRADLTSDTDMPQPGTRLVEAIAQPSQVPANTQTENLLRAAAAGGMGGLLIPGLIGPVAGASGAVTGNVAAQTVPEWAKPAAELAGNLVGGAAPFAVRPAVNALAQGVQKAAGPPLPPDYSPLAPRPSEPPPGATPAGPEAAPAGGGGPQPGMGAAQPAGAQVTPAYEAIHTPAEEAAYRATAEGKKLLEPQIIGERDLNQYIPGEDANSAEREQTVNAARDLKQLGIRTPDASQAQKAAAESNNTARTIYLENTTKGPVEINNRRTQRQADIEADKATVFAPDNIKGPVDFEPVVAHMEDVLRQPTNRQNSALQAVYRPLLERIRNANIDDPAEAWGLRQDIDRMTSKRAQSEDVNLHHVAHQLDDVSGVIDKQIEDVAPGYDAMLAKYKEHSRAIDEMDVLQKAKDKLRGPGQTLSYNDFQRFMKNVVDSRSTPSFDLNPYKAISEDNMQRLWNIRDSLRRTAGALDLARAAGSDTMPNIVDAMKAYAKLGGQGALHLAAGHLFGPGGNIALDVVGRVGKALADERTRARDVRRMGQMLHPPEPLRPPPGQENPLSGAPPP